MHINITKSETGNNKGSCSKLVDYLEKENSIAEKANDEGIKEYWFNHEKTSIQPYEVRPSIDENVAKLSRDEAKFYLINISPSEKELLFLKEHFGEEGAKAELKKYTNSVMEAYAKNFHRKGINSNADLIYFGKLEHHRYYSFKDAEVKAGKSKKGEVKPGEQMHIQIIVSRKDATNLVKLSPLNNSRGRNQEHSQKVGQFNRVNFKEAAEVLFDKTFDYERKAKETFLYANTLKNGTNEEEKEQIITQGRNEKQKSLLSILMNPSHQEYIVDQYRRKKRKRKRRSQQ